ncbi:type II secretion system protein [Pimelobacter simplex]|uniref:type II secretion system protein n=1 Tax=Nocardioides simplex TaxID=2045 RepID=UPI00382CE094
MRRISDRLTEARRDQRGFTLIELLIVIVILGVLAAIVVFSVRGITDRGKTSACKADVATVQTAVEAYYAKQTTSPAYPADEAAATAALVPDFLNSWPADVDYTLTGGVPTVTGVGC